MQSRGFVIGATATLVALAATVTSACPVCDTETGTLVRAGIFGDDFWVTLLQVVAPLPALLAIVLRLHFGKWDRP